MNGSDGKLKIRRVDYYVVALSRLPIQYTIRLPWGLTAAQKLT